MGVGSSTNSQGEKKITPVSEVEDEAVVAGVLAPERLAQLGAAADGGPRQRVEVALEGELRVVQHVDAAPQLGLVPCGTAPGLAHPAGAPEDLDVVELSEDGQQRVRRQRRPVTRRVAQPAPVAAAARGRHRSGSRAEPSGGRRSPDGPELEEPKRGTVGGVTGELCLLGAAASCFPSLATVDWLATAIAQRRSRPLLFM